MPLLEWVPCPPQNGQGILFGELMTKLFKYQRTGVDRIEFFNGNALLADDMGLGKSIQALTWLHENLPEKQRKVVIVCPASIKLNWQREAKKHYNIKTTVLSGRTPTVTRLENGVYIINYDILRSPKGKKFCWLDVLKKWKPDLVICDEAHYIKSLKAQRTKAIRQLCQEVKHKILISGTPLTNMPAELFSLLNILLPKQYHSWMAYAWRYCAPQVRPWGTEYKGASNLDELHRNLKKTCMIRRRKADVLKDLPPKVHNTVPVAISNRKEYDKAERDFLKWLKDISPEKARSAANAEYLVKRGYLMRLAGQLKLPQVIEWIENFMEETDEKLIFFGVHRNFLDPLFEEFKKSAVMVTGKTPVKDRQRAFDLFTENRKVKLFIGNVQAAGVGWNGQVASHVAFGELPHTPGELTQATDRAHRIGQLSTVHCHYLVSENTIEEVQCDVLRKKQEVLSQVLDGSKEFAKDVSIMVDKLLLNKRAK